VEKLLGLGVSRVIIGTAAINDHAFTEAVLAKYGDKVAIGIDARNGYVATHGWLNTSDRLRWRDDLLRLNVHSSSGVGGAIVGKTLYTGNIDLSVALRALEQK
jgi:phosphoribosylformimino-5-aminoimidazole carboxamide ribonucleotide (ProFAR) isomerase